MANNPDVMARRHKNISDMMMLVNAEMSDIRFTLTNDIIDIIQTISVPVTIKLDDCVKIYAEAEVYKEPDENYLECAVDGITLYPYYDSAVALDMKYTEPVPGHFWELEHLGTSDLLEIYRKVYEFTEEITKQ